MNIDLNRSSRFTKYSKEQLVNFKALFTWTFTEMFTFKKSNALESGIIMKKNSVYGATHH